MNNLFYRNIRAREHLQLFLAAAAGTVFALRLFLFLTGYPQLGGGTLHVAHMLYGGLLMMAAIVLTVSFLGERVRHFSSLIGGIGFGLFIDELGKFITKDNNYFFRPTIGLIYAVFVIIFLIFNYVGRQTDKLNDREYELNALNQFEEAVLHDLDPAEKQRIVDLLGKVSNPGHVTDALLKMLQAIETVKPPQPRFIRRLIARFTNGYKRFWNQPWAAQLFGFIFVAQAIILLATVASALITGYNSDVGLDTSHDAYANRLLVAELISTSVSAVFAVSGAAKLFKSRLLAYDDFRIALVINIFLSEFFIFTRIQFKALPGFVFSLLLLGVLRFAIAQEKHLRHIRL